MPLISTLANASSRGYRIFAAGEINSYESIATTTVGSAQTTIPFSSIPGTYKHLQVRMLARTTAAGNNYSAVVTANSDTTVANYRSHYIYGLGSGTPTAGDYQSEGGFYPTNSVAGAGAGSNVFAATVFDILDYASVNKYKTLRALIGQDRNGSGIVQFSSAVWMNSADAITSLTFTVAGGNYDTYSQIALYGIKG